MTLLPGSEALKLLFPATASQTYTDTANYGLPPRTTIAALQHALERWSDGSADWVEDWDSAGDSCRELFAPMIHAEPAEIALMPAASVGAGLVAASLEPGGEILVPEDEFRSILFPLLAAARARGTSVRRVPFGRLAEEIRSDTTLVATSHVRSNGGALQDLEAVGEAAQQHGTRVLIDATHSAGVLNVDVGATRVDFLVAAAYKHLLCPRGVAFLYVSRDGWDDLAPYVSSWRSAAEPYASFYGGDLSDLAPSAARFDVSLAWHAWFGAHESLSLLSEIDCAAREAWAVGLASQFAAGIGVPPTGSSIVGFECGDLDGAREALRDAGVVASFPHGAARVSFHVYNTEEDVETAIRACEALVRY
ncbi:MAG: aminotransferase class V-fold PLP-dependent enzyme [Gaiellaceae bacterium]